MNSGLSICATVRRMWPRLRLRSWTPSMMTEPVYPLMRDLERLGREFGEDVIGSLKFRWRHHGLFAGMELVVVTPELGRYFGTEYGLLVIRAPDDQAIDLQDGDVIREDRRPQAQGSGACNADTALL